MGKAAVPSLYTTNVADMPEPHTLKPVYNGSYARKCSKSCNLTHTNILLCHTDNSILVDI